LKQCRWGRRIDYDAYECVTCGAQFTGMEVLATLKWSMITVAEMLRSKCAAPGRVSIGGCGKAPESHYAHLAEHVRMLQTLPVQIPELLWYQKLRYWVRGKRAPSARERWAEFQRRARQHINDHKANSKA
jgi:hypothetical protein